jgi:hypothetical protein
MALTLRKNNFPFSSACWFEKQADWSMKIIG